MPKSERDFREVWTHDAAYRLIRDTVLTHGARLGAKVDGHRYESSSPHGAVSVSVQAYHTAQTVRYGLPDDRDALRQMAIAALEPPEQWKSQHRRDW